MMTSASHQPSPIAKTAFDSLQAKQSALSVGYTQMVVQAEDTYNDLLRRTGSDSEVRRQIPLVNAGYATRVLAVSHAIHAFVAYHQQTCPTRNIQIVFLGCGVDIIGLWSHALDEKQCQIRVVELDMPSVCATKREFLLEKGFVVEASDVVVEPEGLIGRVMTTEGATMQSQLLPDYFLLPVDLGNISTLHPMLENNYVMDPSQVPTLIVSELVLAYLSPDKTDELLSWCSSNLVRTPGSAMLAVEPLGYEMTSSNRAISVVEGYRRDYCELFHCKMQRGKSTSSQQPYQSSSFYPLGTSHLSVEDRWNKAGFSLVHVTSLGSAAAHASNTSQFRIPEIFDEHAALLLHLQAYVVSVAFPHGVDRTLVRLISPASYAKSEISPVLSKKKIGILYTPLESRDEDDVKRLFHDTYSGLFDTYPAIRKMVKGVMSREFASSAAVEKCDNHSLESEILTRYKAQGGCFFVAVEYKDEVPATVRKVVGCIGVHQCDRQDTPGTLEVFRLAVEENYRGQGIGRQLLEMVETFAISRHSPKLIANTLTVLERALVAYESCGYQIEGDAPLGTLTMRTFYKILSTCQQNHIPVIK